MVFKKDCSACRQQVKDLNCLDTDTDVLLVGSFSTEAELRQEYQSFHIDLPGLYGDSDFKSFAKLKSDVTPQVIISHNYQIKNMIGLQPCHKIKTQLQKVQSL